jgi:hypothetical protein
MPAGHVQIAPDSTGKDVDADSITSTEAGTPTVYRQNVLLADPLTYTAKTRVFAPGQVRASLDPSQLFIDTFDASLDTVNRWNAPVASGTGAIAAAWSAGQILLTGGTAANAYSELHSQPTFLSDEPGWDLITFRISLEFPVLTTAYRFWGLGQTTGTPTVAAPLTDACGWEIATSGKMYAVSWQSGTRVQVGDLSAATGNGTQPGDANPHKYFLYFRGDQSYWAVDTPDNVVASFSTGASGPNVNQLPLKALAVSNSGTAATIQVNAVSVGDTAKNNSTVSDPNYPWRQANVSAAGALSVGPAPGTGTQSSVASSASSVTLLAANAARKQATFFNDSTATLYLLLGTGPASATAYTVQLLPQAYFEIPWPVYTGQVTGIWSAANGNCRVTELT